MFIEFPRVDGIIVSVAPKAFVVASIPPGNVPRNTVWFRFNGGTFYTTDALGTVVAKLAPYVPLVQLTDPRRSIIWLNATAVTAITGRIEWRDPPPARASLVLGGRPQAVMETPAAVRAALAAANPDRFMIA